MTTSEKILVVESFAQAGGERLELLQSAGYEVSTAGFVDEALAAVRAGGASLGMIDATTPNLDVSRLIAELRGSGATEDVRLMVLCGSPAEAPRWLDLGADDVVPCSASTDELLARVRVQLRAWRSVDELRRQARIAEEGQQMAQTAFTALAVTEKMTRDAFTLDRRLKVGVTAFIVVAAVMAGIYLLFFRTATEETQRAYAAIARLERGIASEEQLVARAAQMREELEKSSTQAQQQALEQRSAELREQMTQATNSELAKLRKQLDENNLRLRSIERESRVAQGIIRSYAPSVALLHVAVAFQHNATGRRLRYLGLNPQGTPISDSQGNPIFDLEGRGPEVRADFFGSGFLVAADGRLLTNRHVIEPWWRNDELTSALEGFTPVIAEMKAYFPGSPAAISVRAVKVSPDADLAVVQGNLGGLKREVLRLDARASAAVSGQAVVLIGYATGLDAILARAGEDTVRAIVGASGGDASRIMTELARRNLIRPLTTQGHVGDVLTDRIVYDAQTTSGGSGGPVFNSQGRVIGVNFAVVRGFGGSNFGIPARLAEPLLK
ncbi:MAG: trypsin-like peptidase domain-containing protein [Candidatus Acidiferrales bacterium]